MTVQYLRLEYEEYKAFEDACKAFEETTHKSASGFYHRSFRVKINESLIMEFHGPLVMAGEGEFDLPKTTKESTRTDAIFDNMTAEAREKRLKTEEMWGFIEQHMGVKLQPWQKAQIEGTLDRC